MLLAHARTICAPQPDAAPLMLAGERQFVIRLYASPPLQNRIDSYSA
jgi:hypothetical protein